MNDTDTDPIPGPGLYPNLDEGIYHGGLVAGEPSLSHSGMKTLLNRTASRFRWEIDNRELAETKKEYDVGSAVHTLVLGAGPELVDVGEAIWSGAKKAEVAAIREAGLIPLKTRDYQRAHAMAAAVARHPSAAALLADGAPEVSAFVRDPDTGVMLRARFDWLRADGRLVDFKTAADANPAHFDSRALRFGYYLQDPTYQRVAEWCGVDVAGFEFVLVDDDPPYDVAVCHLGTASRELGWLHARHAIDLFAECMTTGVWPGYPAESVEVELPGWALRELDYATEPHLEDDAPDGDIFAFLDSINT
jgi:hypothetical protein